METKGYDEKATVKEAAAHRWVSAVNAEGTFGAWCYAMARNPNDVPRMIDEIATQTSEATLASH
jgi:type III restriction enzyme